MLQATPPYFIDRTQDKRICETTSGLPGWKASVLVGNTETTQALLVWPHHTTQRQNHPARHPGGQETKGPPEKELARQYTRMDTSRPTDSAYQFTNNYSLLW